MFHRFRPGDATTAWQGALSSEDFERILLHVGIGSILAPDEWLSRLGEGRLCDQDICITFDDGLRCQVDHALPVLERYGLQAFWFVYSCVFSGRPVRSEVYSYVAGEAGGMAALSEEFLSRCAPDMLTQLNSSSYAAYAALMREAAPFYTLSDVQFRFLRNQTENRAIFEGLMDCILTERGVDVEEVARGLWLDDADLRELTRRGHQVGLHSYDHPYDIAQLSRQEQQDQYERNYTHIATVTGHRPRCMSHPLNSYSGDSLTVLTDLGIQCGFRANLLAPAGKEVNASCLELAREDSANLAAALMSESS